MEQTPLNIRTSGLKLGDALRDVVVRRIQRQLGKFEYHLSRVTVRFRDVNGPRGGVDSEVAIKAVLTGAPSVVAKARSAEPREAFDEAARVVTRAVRKGLDKLGWSRPKARPQRTRSSPERRQAVVNPPPSGGELIGRRRGQSARNVRRAAQRPEKVRRDALVDTAQPRVSATARKAGGGSTAARNTQLNPRSAVHGLEDSATGVPSRKSTRRSAGRLKRDDPQRRAAVRKVASPRSRAAKARAKRR